MTEPHTCRITIGTPPPGGTVFCVCEIGEDHDDTDMKEEENG